MLPLGIVCQKQLKKFWSVYALEKDSSVIYKYAFCELLVLFFVRLDLIHFLARL